MSATFHGPGCAARKHDSTTVTGDLVWCMQGLTIGQMGCKIAIDDVGCDNHSVTELV